MTVRLRKMNKHLAEHEEAASRRQPARRSITERESEDGTDERGECEHRPGARGAERALREKIEA